MDIDEIVSAELPDPDTQPDLYSCVVHHMRLGPCGLSNPACPCMNQETRQCTRNYPREVRSETLFCAGGYPQYRRRANTRTTGQPYNQNNRDIVPYNPYLLLGYDAHINVEIRTSIKVVKYLYKYIHKGPDRARIVIHNSIDEVTNYLDSRYVTASEAVWHIFKFHMHDKSHVVDRLPVHLPRQQVIIAAPGAEREAYEKALGKRTKLEAYFDLNRRLCACVAARLPAPQPIPYEQMPSRYTWNSKTSEWVPRANASAGARVLGRLTSASVSERERYFLRTLLKYVHDAAGYGDLLLKRGPDMEPLQHPPQAAHHAAFYDAAMNLGLMADDQLSRDTFSEALAVMTAPALRRLFVLLLEWMPFADSHQVWEKLARARR